MGYKTVYQIINKNTTTKKLILNLYDKKNADFKSAFAF